MLRTRDVERDRDSARLSRCGLHFCCKRAQRPGDLVRGDEKALVTVYATTPGWVVSTVSQRRARMTLE